MVDMDNNQDFLNKLSSLDKKIDRLTNLVTKIAKTLHLVPVTEKEEREIQLLQRGNLQQAAKVSADLDAMSPKNEAEGDESIATLFAKVDDIFGDVIADDFLHGGN